VEVKGHVELGTECVLGNNLLFRTHKDGAIALGDGVEVDDYAMMLANNRTGHQARGAFPARFP
jgi:hypothetical protein